jgi:C_GCAxxG_C_C family probable redox protein
MDQKETLIDERVHEYYWVNDYNCATTMLKILAEIYGIELSSQILNSAVGMHGAGKYGAQCGLVEGSLMFIGIYGRQKEKTDQEIVGLCYTFADKFKKEFESLNCRELRPEGFRPENPPHICEDLTKRAVRFTIEYIRKNIIKKL